MNTDNREEYERNNRDGIIRWTKADSQRLEARRNFFALYDQTLAQRSTGHQLGILRSEKLD